jgi:hypothetical protein
MWEGQMLQMGRLPATDKMLALIEEFRKLHPEFPPQAMTVFAHIAKLTHDGQDSIAVPFRDLEKITGLSRSGANRIINLLDEGWTSATGRWVPGHNLITTGVSDLDARAKEVRGLTAKGRMVWASIKRILED